MKRVKCFLLGSVAGLATVAGAQAADLPVAKAAPVEYVRVCSAEGTGFFYIPGTETCLRVSGRVRADYLYGETFDRSDDAFGWRARGRIQLDARTLTAYGKLRALVRAEFTRSSGTPFGNEGVVGGTSPNIAQAYIQFGGLTAGRVTSFFAADLPTGHMGTLRFYDAPDVDLLAYTFSFGNGFSATISLEDPLETRVNQPLLVGFTPAGVPITTVFPYAGTRAPDLVGNIKYTGTWGNAQLSGAVSQIRSDVIAVTTPTGIVGVVPDTEYGFAVQAAASFNLPMLGANDALWINAAYANGALSYLGFGPQFGGGVGGLLTGNVASAFIDPVTGDIERGEGWSVAGGLRHYWTPTIRQNVFGSYASVEYGAGIAPEADFTEWRLGTNVFWSPVAGLDIGVEVIYANLDRDGAPLLVDGRLRNDDDDFSGRLRIQRDF